MIFLSRNFAKRMDFFFKIQSFHRIYIIFVCADFWDRKFLLPLINSMWKEAPGSTVCIVLFARWVIYTRCTALICTVLFIKYDASFSVVTKKKTQDKLILAARKLALGLPSRWKMAYFSAFLFSFLFLFYNHSSSFFSITSKHD